MVYMPAGVVGWRPFARSWLLSLKLQTEPSTTCDEDGSTRDQGPQRGGSSSHPDKQQQLAAAAVCQQLEKLPPEHTDDEEQGEADSASEADTSEAGTTLLGERQRLEPVQDLIWSLLEAFVDPLLEWVRSHGREAVPTVDVALVQAAASLLGRLLDTEG